MSTRLRKPVNYTIDYLEIDDVEKSLEREIIGIKDNEQLEVGDSSLQSFSRDHLERGDGLFLDGEEAGLLGVNQNSYFFRGELSNDYLEMGGGFCLDESDTGMDQGTAHSPPTTVDGETGDLLEDVEHDTELLNEVRDGGRTRASDTELNADNVVAAHADGHLRSRRGGQLLAQEV
ncbi:hypothetical protein OIU74_026906 [Salix koriyanagi]|uniref:Uncharacterized protein n=1 Tax=Salix koriyanagi TaxID=2511006 RepID=A0A9Q0VZ97_9ROSI|nr:hypothetical protein OIU74_026906 [Salix koriyanagi]